MHIRTELIDSLPGILFIDKSPDKKAIVLCDDKEQYFAKCSTGRPRIPIVLCDITSSTMSNISKCINICEDLGYDEGVLLIYRDLISFYSIEP